METLIAFLIIISLILFFVSLLQWDKLDKLKIKLQNQKFTKQCNNPKLNALLEENDIIEKENQRLLKQLDNQKFTLGQNNTSIEILKGEKEALMAVIEELSNKIDSMPNITIDELKSIRYENDRLKRLVEDNQRLSKQLDNQTLEKLSKSDNVNIREDTNNAINANEAANTNNSMTKNKLNDIIEDAVIRFEKGQIEWEEIDQICDMVNHHIWSPSGDNEIRKLIINDHDVNFKVGEFLKMFGYIPNDETYEPPTEVLKPKEVSVSDYVNYDDLALFYASGCGHTEIVKLLLENGADVHARDDLALRLASGNGHTEVVKLLQQYQ